MNLLNHAQARKTTVGRWTPVRAILSLGVTAALCGCSGSPSGSSGFTPSASIQVSPSGTAANPVDQGCNSFNIYATEANYSGTFTISMSGANNYYRLPQNIASSGVWTISPGLICAGGSQAAVATFTIRDQHGNSAVTYITTF